VPWTKPEDIPFDANGPLPPLGGRFPAGALVLMADGSVRTVRKTVSERTWKFAIMNNDGMPLGSDWR
jgi:hypothetical protein